jgi:O-antigen/teichoic acid export membrane protein
MAYALPILLRYLSMVLQFVTLIFVTRRLSPEDVGAYYAIFGFVNTTYFLAGFGIPDGMVKWVAHAISVGESSHVRALIRRGAIYTGVLTVASAVAAAILLVAVKYPLPLRMILLISAWWICYGVLFFGSQVLVALRRTSLGAFFFYPASSIALFVTSVPYLLLSRQPTILGTMEATVAGALACAIGSTLYAALSWREFPRGSGRASLAPVFRLGSLLAGSRVIQTSLYWIPVWGIGFGHGASAVAAMGTASRLSAAVSAVMAAIRFTIRPTIVNYAAKDDWRSIARESNQVATAATLSTLLAIAGTLVFGSWAIGLVYGAAYRQAAPLLAVFLIGTLAESIGGPVDVILTLTGKARQATATLVVAAAIEAVLVWAVIRQPGVTIAGAQSLVFVAMYAYLLWLVWRLHHVYVGARFTLPELKKLFQKVEPKKA